MLVLLAVDLPIDSDPKILEQVVTDEQRKHILALFEKRAKDKIPSAYLVNASSFAGLPFYVDERVIIPRSPIAELIEVGFAPWINPDKVRNVLDVCTGCACIAIACGYAFPDAEVDAIDISQDVLDVAKINVEKHKDHARVNLIKSDLFQYVPSKKYDIIVSNPPYVSDKEMAALPGEFRHEPQLALQADDAGLALAYKIMQSANDYLEDDGILVIEVGNSAETLHARHPDWPLIWLDFERGGDGVFLMTKNDLRLIFP